MPRKSIKELLLVPLNGGAILFEVTIFAAILFPVFRQPLLSFFEFWVVSLCALPFFAALLVTPFAFFETRQQKAVILTSYGASRYQGKKQIEMPWPAFLFVLNWSGDVILTTFASSIFVPREAFASPQKRREFVQIARELHKSRGAAWRDEWKGQVFSSEPENAPRNLPK